MGVRKDLLTPTRTLVYTAIIHTEADMGALSESVQRANMRRFGMSGWKQKLLEVDKIWTAIEQAIERLKLPYQRVRLYQDGLPVCGREADIVRELAGRGSRNHRLLLYLMEKGATLMGTESQELLIEEYEFTKASIAQEEASNATTAKVHRQVLSDSILERRDRAIGNRINSTLQNGEIGIIFLGMLHSLEGLLEPDIRIEYLLKPFGGQRSV